MIFVLFGSVVALLAVGGAAVLTCPRPPTLPCALCGGMATTSTNFGPTMSGRVCVDCRDWWEDR